MDKSPSKNEGLFTVKAISNIYTHDSSENLVANQVVATRAAILRSAGLLAKAAPTADLRNSERC